MTEDYIKLPPKNITQYCSGCGRRVDLQATETFMCSHCKNYFCEECAYFYHENIAKNCPGDKSDPHNIVLVKITRLIKEFSPMGVSIQQLENNTELGRSKSGLIIQSESINTSNEEAKIIDDDNFTSGPSKSKEKKSRVLILDDET